MDYELDLTKANRLLLARAFAQVKRVDCSIDCVVEGQMGRAFVDDLDSPTAYRITVGPFWYYAGDAHGPTGHRMMEAFPAYNLLMPSGPDWLELAREVYGERLQPFTRYSFSPAQLSHEHLAQLLERSPHRAHITPIDVELATTLAALPESYLELSDFDSAEDFVRRALAYAVKEGDTVKGVAYSSLINSRGIEVSLYVEEPYRQQGVATALSSQLLLACLERNLRPNWDAANPESCKLALKLGYVFTESYDAHYHVEP